jgi:nucleotide-binding universal stress UspA family protein
MDSKHVAALTGTNDAAQVDAPEASAFAQGKAVMSFAISRILVPVDFSPHSDHALRYAAALAGRLDALVEIFHVVEEPVAAGAWSSEIPVSDLSELRDRLIAEAARQIDHACRPIIESSDVRTVTTVRMGQPGQTIAAYAGTAGIDLIVMGTHGRGVSHLLMGYVAERVARYAPCPVLTVRARETHEELEPVFVAHRAVFGSVLGHHGTSRE